MFVNFFSRTALHYLSADYWAFVGRLQEALRLDYRPAYSVIGRLSKVALALWLIANGALLAGCAAGALTCDGATLRRGETCEVRPAFIRWTTAVPKGMR